MQLEKVSKVVGIKQSRRAISENLAKKVYFAEDAEERLIVPLVSLCNERAIPFEYVESMKQLGENCGIEVGAAVVAVL